MHRFADLTRFFQPESVAIVGASGSPERIGGRPLRFFLRHGYRGEVFLVNPSRTHVGELPCYPSISAVPRPVDLAVLAVDAARIPDELQRCAQAGVPFTVVFSGGFGEAGDDGAAAQRRIREIVESTGVRVCGPNTIGMANLFDGVCPSFAICLDREAEPGPVGFVSQSGALGSAILGQSLDNDMGIGVFACTGNEVDLEFADYAHHLLQDPRIAAVAGYIEGLRDGGKFLRLADLAMELGKPLVLLKVGGSRVGARTASSHTGSMAGEDRVYDAVFRQKGVLRARNTDELLDYALLAAMAPEPAGNRVAILSISGGANVLMADECELAGLALPALSDKTMAVLEQHIPAFGSMHNPVDLTGQFINSPEALPQMLDALVNDPNVDAVIFFMSVMYPQEDLIVDALHDAARSSAKPIVAVWAAGPAGVLQRLRKLGVVALAEPTRAVRALAGYCRFARLRAAAMSANREAP